MNDIQEKLKAQKKFKRLERLAWILDSHFSMPGTKIRFGLDPIAGLIPGIGDTITLLVSLYIIYQARYFNIPGHVILKMITNVFIDWSIGSIPIIGDIFDLIWKANQKNISLIADHLKD